MIKFSSDDAYDQLSSSNACKWIVLLLMWYHQNRYKCVKCASLVGLSVLYIQHRRCQCVKHSYT